METHERSPGSPDDPYSRTAYRRMIAWTRRIEREGPFLRRLLDEAPDASVVDLGCGTGEHTAFLARAGARAVGLDRSESMLTAARDHESRGEGRFVEGDMLAAHEVLADEPPFGLALCLGNVLPHLRTDEDLERFVSAVHSCLAPGGRLLLQILNYERIVSQGVRTLPVNVRAGDGEEEIVFLRLMRPIDGGRILFFPTTLRLDPASEQPVVVETTRRVELRAWTAADLVPRFEAHDMAVELCGDMVGGPYDATASSDLVLLATRAPT